MENIKNHNNFAEAVENYEVAEALSSIRWNNKKAKSIYQMAFDQANAMMQIIEEELNVDHSEVLEAVREVANI